MLLLLLITIYHHTKTKHFEKTKEKQTERNRKAVAKKKIDNVKKLLLRTQRVVGTPDTPDKSYSQFSPGGKSNEVCNDFLFLY